MAAAFSRQVAGRTLYNPRLQASLSRLDRLVDWERRLRAPGEQRAMRVDTQPAKKLLQQVGNPERSFRAVHVTGSKGKGSVSALVGAGLSTSGALVGVYGSPHVERVNERIRIGGVDVNDDTLAYALNDVLDARDECCHDATWFDVVTAAGMLAMQRVSVDWAVVEVGMGGRLDSTNVLNAPVVVVTNIALEHKEIIGPTLRDIAHEKAGIISKGCTAIVGMACDDALADVFRAQATDVGDANVIFLPPTPESRIRDHNLALSRHALAAALGTEPSAELLPDNLADQVLSSMPGRAEIFLINIDEQDLQSAHRSGRNTNQIKVTLDGAHVPNSVQLMLTEVTRCQAKRLVVVLGVGREKDAHGICTAISAFAPSHVFATRVAPDTPYLPALDLIAIARAAGVQNAVLEEDPDEAVRHALIAARSTGGQVVVIGSLHLAGRVRPLLRELCATGLRLPR